MGDRYSGQKEERVPRFKGIKDRIEMGTLHDSLGPEGMPV